MRKPIAILAALGFLGATSLPTMAAPASTGVVKNDDFSAAKKKAAPKKKKKSELTSTDISAAKKKADNMILYRIAA